MGAVEENPEEMNVPNMLQDSSFSQSSDNENDRERVEDDVQEEEMNVDGRSDSEENGDDENDSAENDNVENDNIENANDVNDDEDVDDEAFLRNTLQYWAADGGAASMNKLNVLLRNLAVRFPSIPLSYKTLLRTPRRIEVTAMNNDSVFWYKGIRATLNSMELQAYLQRYGQVELDVNMDGLSLSKSSSLKFWPILGYLVGSENPPFVICIFLGEKDPDDVYAYLMDFVYEVDSLNREGYLCN